MTKGNRRNSSQWAVGSGELLIVKSASSAQFAAKLTNNRQPTTNNPQELKRRGGDSNSRGPFGPTGFRNRRIQPLCHLSERARSIYRTGLHLYTANHLMPS